MSRRIGLLTLPLQTNYGGILQAVALNHFLASQGNKVFLLERDYPRRRFHTASKAVVKLSMYLPGLRSLHRLLSERPGAQGVGARIRAFGPLTWLNNRAGVLVSRRLGVRLRPFQRRFGAHGSGVLHSTEDMTDAVARLNIDTLIVGSDQVWRLDYLPRGAEEDFFLGFSKSPAVRKVSYAASFGHSDWTFPRHTKRVKDLLGQFHAISVREAPGREICAREFGRDDAHHVLDPTLLVDRSFYDMVAAPPNRGGAPVLLNYILDKSEDRGALCREILAALGPEYSLNSLVFGAGERMPTVPEWLRAFMDADFVVTDSFHGMVFSIIFRKNFIAIMNHDRGGARFTSLLGQFGLMERLVSDPTPEKLRQLAQTPIDYGPVGARLDEWRAVSADFLTRALA